MRRRDISTILLASTAAVAGGRVRAASAAPDLPNDIAAAERAASVTSVDARYPPGCVDRYASNLNPGATPMASAFATAIRVARLSGTPVTYGATAPYLLDAPLDATFAGREAQHGLVIRNVGDAASARRSLIVRHRGVAAFDFTGTDCVELYDVVIGTDPVLFPQTGVLWARNRHRGSLFHKMQNCRFDGKFAVAALYNYGAESDCLIDCYFANHAGTPGTKAAVWTASNISGLRSMMPDVMATGPQSCIDHNGFGNQYYNSGGTDTSDCVYLDQADSWKNFGGWAYSASLESNGRALVFVDLSRGASNFALLQGLTGEVSTYLQSYGILFSDHRATPTGWTVDSCRLPNATYAVHAAASTTLDHFHLRNVSEQASHGLWAAGTVQNSILETGALPLSIGRSRHNSLTGHSENWSVGRRDCDAWIDQCGSRSFDPDLSALRGAGAIHAQARFLAHGALITVNVVLSGTRSIRTAQGTIVGGLPFAACAPAQVQLFNLDAGAALPAGHLEGDRMYLPAFETGTDRILISATYLAA